MARLRLVSTSPDNTEILCALGLIDDLVGISAHCDFPEGLAQEKPVVSDFKTANVDAIQALAPDIVFCSTFYQAEMARELAKGHCRVFVSQATTLASIYQNILLMGQLVDRKERAQMLVAHMQESMPPQPSWGLTVFTEEWGNPIVLAAPWIHEVVTLAGGTPLFADQGQAPHTDGRVISADAGFDSAPDVILMPWCGAHGKQDVGKAIAERGWQETPAARRHHVFALEDSLFVRPGPRLINGYQVLCQLFAQCQAEVPALS